MRRTAAQQSLCQQAHRAKRHSTNPIERLNGEIKRRTDAVGLCTSRGPMAGTASLPNEAAVIRLVGAVQRARDMRLETTAPIGDNPLVALSAATV